MIRYDHHLTFAQRASDRVTAFCGSWAFIFIFSGLTLLWIVLNSLLILFGAFDPYPFIFFNLVLTVIGTFQGPLIMMSQNRQADRDRDAVQSLHDKLSAIDAALKARLAISKTGGIG